MESFHYIDQMPPMSSSLQKRGNVAPAVDETVESLEHMGEWDHGVEPNAGGAIKDETSGNAKKQEHKEGDPKYALDRLAGDPGLVQQAEDAVVKAMHTVADVGQKALHALKDDAHLQEEVKGHTEEEVLGEKLCVSEVIHQDSFIAPC